MIRSYTGLSQISGDIAELNAQGVGLGELAELRSPDGRCALAQVIRLVGSRVSLQVFQGARGLSTAATVRFLERPAQLTFSEHLLGRIFNGAGEPIDGKPRPPGRSVDIGGPSVNPVRRVVPRRFIETGVPMIDVFNPLVESQKLPIFSEPGQPHNALLARIALQAQADVIIFGGIALRHDEYLHFREIFAEGGVLDRTMMFVHTASDPVIERLLVPDMALAAAEQLAIAKKRVLVLLTDLTAFADALKEVSIAMEQIPSKAGYPGSLYSELAARYEKAVDFSGAGSITILGVTTMPGGDVTHPVPDNTGYITEGQFYLRDGAIDPFASLSRLKQQVMGKATREDHGPLANAMIRLYARARESEKKLAMGFERTEEDERLLRYGTLFEQRFMDLNVSLTLLQALDLGWRTLAECFSALEVGMKQSLLDAYWPKEP